MAVPPPDPAQLSSLFFKLKDEIISIDNRNSQLLALSVTASGTIFGFGFHQDNPQRPWVFLCVFIVLFPAYTILLGYRRHVWRISTYLRVFVEPYLSGIKWETRLDQQKKLAGSKKLSSGITTNEFRLLNSLSIMVFLAISVNFIQVIYSGKNGISDPTPFLNYLSSIILGAILCLVFFFRSRKFAKSLQRNGEVEMSFYASWLKVKNKEEEELTSEEPETIPKKKGRP